MSPPMHENEREVVKRSVFSCEWRPTTDCVATDDCFCRGVCSHTMCVLRTDIDRQEARILLYVVSIAV